MLDLPDFTILEEISDEKLIIQIDSLFHRFLNEMRFYLQLEPYFPHIKVRISEAFSVKDREITNIFDIGVNRNVQNGILFIEIYKNRLHFRSFIILREIYNLFIMPDLHRYEVVQLVINQLLMTDLSKHPLLIEWKELIRANLASFDLLSKGYNRLIVFDRLEKFFQIHAKETPARFFFEYLRRNKTLISDNVEDIHEIFFQEFTNYISKLESDEIVESIRILTNLFYKKRKFKDFLSYKILFQELKENGELDSELSLRKFTNSMDWIKNYSYIAPSYLLNWKAIDTCLLVTFLRFNPIIQKHKIITIMKNFPFFTSLKISSNSFSTDFSGYIVIPQIYMDDFKRLLHHMKKNGYLIDQYCLLFNHQIHRVNLNYFRNYSREKRIINLRHPSYEERYEIEFQMNYGKKFFKPIISLLDFLILERIQSFSIYGFGFERRAEALRTLKTDLLNEIITQRTQVKNLKAVLQYFYEYEALKTDLLQLIDDNKGYGFFYVRETLEQLLAWLRYIKNIATTHFSIKSEAQLKNIVENEFYSFVLEDNIMLNNHYLKAIIFKDFIPLYFHSKKDYKQQVEKYQKYYDFFTCCYNLKLFDLNMLVQILLDKDLIKTIYEKKEEKLKSSYESYKEYQITIQLIDETIDNLLNTKPPLIHPILITTIITNLFVKDFLELILHSTPRTHIALNKIKMYFPRILINRVEDIYSKREFIYVELWTPNLTNREKFLLYSIVNTLFGDQIIYGKSYLWSGMIRFSSVKNFYDFENGEFFYTQDLYKQFYLYVKRIFGKRLKYRKALKNKNQYKFWSSEETIEHLIDVIEQRDASQERNFSIANLRKLVEYNISLPQYLLDMIKFKEAKQEDFFKNHVKSIKFIPALSHFGLATYFLYIHPLDMNKIDYRLLLLNLFENIKYSASISDSNSLLIQYIMPLRSPNDSYINWLTKSGKFIREYCLFFIKKVYSIFHVNFNLSSTGWIYSADNFKIFLQNILFNPDYKVQTPELKEFVIVSASKQRTYEPDSLEFTALSSIYNWRSIDMKSYIGTKKSTTIGYIRYLLEKKLIFPYLSLKNIDLWDDIYIILPNINPQLNKILIKIFSYFNRGFIYEIEGQFFIYGFPEEKKFEHGLFIHLIFPKCDLSAFFRVFDLLFEYLQINPYMILHDLLEGDILLKSIFGSLEFLKSYNPLKNLIWSNKDKTWLNEKLFTEKFEKNYPKLLEEE